ncbi:MAG: VWA domain-containing protein, partial [Nitrososphaerales archaeon]
MESASMGEQSSSELSQAPEPAAQRGLLAHVIGFGRLLRIMGVETSPSQMLDLVQALEHVSIADHTDFYWTSRGLLVKRREDFLVFDQAFAIFWNAREHTGGDAVDAMAKEPQAKPRMKRARLPQSEGAAASVSQAGGKAERVLEPDAGADEEARTQVTRIAYYSPVEVSREKDFREMTWEEAQAARRAMAHMEWRLGMRRTRRYCRGRRGRLNMRRVFRDNLRYGGDVLDLAYRTRVMHPRPLVVLC